MNDTFSPWSDDHPTCITNSSCDQFVWLIFREANHTMRATQVIERSASRLRQTDLDSQIALDKMDDNFSVGFGFEFDPLGSKFVAQFQKVFNDAIMHNDHAASHTHMRVGITSIGFTMGSPTSMSDSQITTDWVFFDEMRKHR